MSGFVGIVNLDGAPVDSGLLADMTASMAFRGPDACEIRMDGAMGFGHCLLRTCASENNRQPFSLDGRVWIAADASLDARVDLCRDLEAHGRRGIAGADAATLIAHAYAEWGEDCVDHLLGDFAFGIWDAPRHTLLCARDHLGVKPFYYAQSGGCLVFSNTLNCVRQHPAVSSQLNDHAIGDFLLFGYNQNPATTTFADIQRLPAGHVLTWRPGSLRVRRYWTLPADIPPNAHRADDYVGEFRARWRTAVEDRLRGDRVGVLMSGGLDSTSVAVTAQACRSSAAQAGEVSAYTLFYERLIPDRERHYAGLVAASLGIPIHYLAADAYGLFERIDEAACQTPEPSDNPLPAMTADLIGDVASRCRVALTGEGGDAALAGPTAAEFANLLRTGRLRTWTRNVFRCVVHGQRPPLGIRSALRQWTRNGQSRPAYPAWIAPDFAARIDLAGRWKTLTDETASPHLVRPGAHRTLGSPFWPYLFETYDPGVTSFPLQVRHPFFDVRLLTYLLTVPPVPWFVNKTLLREAMHGSAPEPVRRRRKKPLLPDPVSVRLRQPAARWLNRFDAAPELLQYVDLSKVPRVAGLPHQVDQYRSAWHELTRPLSLNYWLAGKEAVRWRTRTI
jgi:asparagine synthase (glutamine-hydrolysing)